MAGMGRSTRIAEGGWSACQCSICLARWRKCEDGAQASGARHPRTFVEKQGAESRPGQTREYSEAMLHSLPSPTTSDVDQTIILARRWRRQAHEDGAH
jgi:hypothetical protein